ncbi:serine hydrolase domain-containing protein [Fredinandcohnia sp. 179-A 10B2 NHS]|uniref:serine hydrolase domain-containing protein n=1 Tax=Fredinandcohnia sp. 179-A 10B2 NHS TaxID=3235176 RepID=UPI00399FD748
MSKQLLQKYMEKLGGSGHFNGSILVACDKEILLSEGYGMASFQYMVPNTAKTKFRIGSLSKAFTAVGILKLVEQGKLNLTETIDLFFPSFQEGNKITIHHLLTHTSGIEDIAASPDYWERDMRLPTTLEKLVETLQEKPLEFSPGERMEYSNSGYLVATAIIEKVTGISFSEFLTEEIFRPLNMLDSGVDNGRTIVPQLAAGHTVHKEIIHTEFIDMSIPQGAYGLYSSVEDLHKWGLALMNETILNKNLLDLMFTENMDGYGYGWFLTDKPKKIASHSGDINGFVSDFQLFLDDRITIIMLSNVNITPVEKISADIAKIVNGESIEVEIIPEGHLVADTESVVGEYKNNGVTISVEQKDATSIFVTAPKKYGVPYTIPFQLVNAENGRLVYIAEFINEKAIFLVKEDGISLIYVNGYGTEQEFLRN